MSPVRCRPFALVLAAGLAGPAVVAQVATVAMSTQDTELFGANNTDAGLSVNDPDPDLDRAAVHAVLPRAAARTP